MFKFLEIYFHSLSCYRRKKASAEADASACRETRLHIRRQPGFQHIFGRIESKTGNGQNHSISTSPVF